MSKNKSNPLQSLQSVLAMLLVVFLAVALFTACGSANATAKKEKSKKSKAKRDAPVEDEEEKSESESEKSEDKKSDTADTNKETEEPESGEKTADKKDAKHSDDKKSSKTSDKDKKAAAEAIWTDLMKGNSRFMAGKHTVINFAVSRIKLVKEQHPQVIVLGCSDSRVPPEFVFDKNLGELFVVRDAGNIADEVSLGSIEYAVAHLHSKVLLILGHESCGAVAAAVSGAKMPSKNLRAIVERIAPAFEDSDTCKIGGASNLSCVELNVRHSTEDVLLNSPIIKKAVAEGELTVIRAVYRMETGSVVRLD